jgi:signal transduction histidine kinase
VINDLIDYSSLVSEKFKIHNTNFHLKNTILETMDIVSLGIEQKGIKFILDFEETLPEKIKSDPNRLNQILLNLLGNSY